jgi:hypothetical protein
VAHLAERCYPGPVLTRRTLLAFTALAATPLLGATTARAAGGKKNGKLEKVEAGSGGVTLTFALERAPFPRGSSYDAPQVLVFVPSFYRLPKSRKVDAVIHFHGHNTTARRAIAEHRLREQLVASKQNAILVVPQGPVNAVDSSGGQLEQKNGLKKLVAELVKELAGKAASAALGDASLAGARSFGHLCVSAHSGGYKVAAACLRRGGLNVNEAYLFDALYSEAPAFRRWVVQASGQSGRARHKLVSFYASAAVREQNLALLAALEADGVTCLHERTAGELSRSQLTKGTAIFLAIPVEHGATTYRQNGLRDCLFASGFKRHQKSDWFDSADAKRKIDQRG